MLRRDGIPYWQKQSTYHLVGPSNALVAFTFLMAATGAIVFGIILHALLVEPEQRIKRLARVTDSLVLFWLSVLSLSILICCVDVYAAQGIWLLRDMEDTAQFRKRQDFATGPWFLYGAVPGAIAALTLCITLAVKMCSPSMATGAYDDYLNANNVEGGDCGRVYKMDYLKYLAMLFIVVGHFLHLPSFDASPLSRVVSTIGWSFCIGAFALSSGYNTPVQPKDMIPRRRARIIGIAIAYLLSMTLYIVFFEYGFKKLVHRHFNEEKAGEWIAYLYQTMERGPLDLDRFFKWLFGPAWFVLWYLQALIFWMLIAPSWMTLRFPFFCSLAVSVIAFHFTVDAYIYPFALARTLQYFPFYILGACAKLYGYDRKFLAFASDPYTKFAAIASLTVLLAFAIACPFNNQRELGGFLYPDQPIDFSLFDRQRWYWIGRTAVIFYCLFNCGSIFVLVPNCRSYITRAAGNSLVPFVFHYFLLMLLVSVGYYGDHVPQFGTSKVEKWRPVVTLIIATAWTIFLFHPPVAKVLKLLIMPPMAWLFMNLRKEIGETRPAPNKGAESSSLLTKQLKV